MKQKSNLQIQLRELPTAHVSANHFQTVEAAVPALAAGQVLTRVNYLSLDPFMRKRMADAAEGRWKLAPGDVMMGRTVGEVIESADPSFAPGDVVLGWGGWQQYAVEPASTLEKVDGSVERSLYLGLLGRPGITAWLGIVHVAQVRPEEVVLISSAAGAVGSIAGQIARLLKAEAIGIAGSDEKCDYVVNELGFRACVNYRSPQFEDDLARATPGEVDVCFENVGAQVLDAALNRMREGGRIALCGLLAHYNSGPGHGLRNFPRLLDRALTLQGFRIDANRSLWNRALVDLAAWLAAGQLAQQETVTIGLENAPRGFASMLAGDGYGKHLVKVS